VIAPSRSRHLFCGVCERRMQGHWANAAAYYRCRFPAEYALANRVSRPLNVVLRQDALLGPLDEWLASKFEPRHLPATIDELAAAATDLPEPPPGEDEISAKITECDRKLHQYRATLDAGADPATVACWITETEAERTRYQAIKRATPPQTAPSMSREEISSVVSALSDLLTVLRTADPADKAEIYTQLGLRLIYQPGDDPAVRAEVRIVPAQHWQFESVRGGT
jgi:site-specific DNA recombinase